MKGKGTLLLIIVDFILKVSSSYFPPGRNEPDWAGLTGACESDSIISIIENSVKESDKSVAADDFLSRCKR